MTRAKFLSLASITLLAGLGGCGDNSKTCGEGTEDVDGVCTSTGGNVQCTNGTILVGDHCEIDPSSCQDGTVLMGDKCVDPSTQTATIEEAAEPNGLGLGGESSSNPAGEIMLKPVGDHFTIHGKIKPFQDADGDGQNDADFDSYIIDVNAPTMISVSADGLHGLAGGFVAVANVDADDPLAAWTRFGVNPMGDTAKRQVYLPAAGIYVIAIADSRSLFLTGAAPGAGMDQPDMEYYVTVDQLTATPTALTATDGVATSQGQLAPGEVKLFSIAMGEGINDAELGMVIDQAQESLVIAQTRSSATTIRAVVDGDAGDGATATSTLLGFQATDSTVVAVDTVFDYSNAPFDYDLTLAVRGAAALSTNGGMSTQPADDVDFSTFYYDVGNDGLLTGMNVSFDRPVAGIVVDQDFFIYSRFSYNGSGFAATFSGYKGLLKHPVTGRYYFIVFDPAFDPAGGPDDIVATSTYGALQPATITKGTVLTNQMTNAYGSNPYNYTSMSSTSPWQLFNGNGTGTGAISAAFYNPNALGRLDPVTLTPACTACNDSPAPVFSHNYAESGTSPKGRILLDDPVSQYFVKVRPATAGTFALDFKDQTYTDLGMLTPTTGASRTDVALDGTTTIQRYLLRTTSGNQVIAVAHPDQLTLNTQIQPLNADESGRGAPTNNGGLGADDTFTAVQSSTWTAFTVTAPLTAIVDGTFDLTASVKAPRPYTMSAGSTAFSDACAGGTTIATTNFSNAADTDEARSGIINTPAGFDFFGFSSPQFRVFTNGFISFDTNAACSGNFSCFFSNTDLPVATSPNALIAPFWDDLDADICQNTVGGKLVIQWSGVNFNSGANVEFQAILDPTNDTIEFVYGPNHTDDSSSATIGLENHAGTLASKVGFNLVNAAAPKLFTPM